MNHEINDNTAKRGEESKGDGGLNFLSVTEEHEKAHEQGIEGLSKALEQNEEAIRAQMERIAEMAKAMLNLKCCPEAHHFDAILKAVHDGADAGEPAHIELKKHLD